MTTAPPEIRVTIHALVRFAERVLAIRLPDPPPWVRGTVERDRWAITELKRRGLPFARLRAKMAIDMETARGRPRSALPEQRMQTEAAVYVLRYGVVVSVLAPEMIAENAVVDEAMEHFRARRKRLRKSGGRVPEIVGRFVVLDRRRAR